MKKVAIILLLALIVAAGIAYKYDVFKISVVEDPQTVITKAWEKLFDEKSDFFRSQEIKLKGAASASMDKDAVSVDFKADLATDPTQPENIKNALKLDLNGTGTLQDKPGKATAKVEIRMLDKKIYAIVETVDVDSGDPSTNQIINLIAGMYKSQWYEFPLKATDETTPITGAEGLFTKEMLEAAKKNNFIEVKRDLGKRTYEVGINVEKFISFIKEMSKVNKQEVTEEQLKAMDDYFKGFFKKTNYTVQVTIADDYSLEGLKVTLATKDEKNQTLDFLLEATRKNETTKGVLELAVSGEKPVKATIEFTLVQNFKNVSIEAPKDAKPFDPGLFGGGLPGPEEDLPVTP